MPWRQALSKRGASAYKYNMKYRKKHITKKIIAAVAIIAFIAGTYAVIDCGLRPNLLTYGEVQLKNTATRVMNKAVYMTLEDEDKGDLDALLSVEKDEKGNVTMVRSDSTTMNRIAVNAAMEAQQLLSESDSCDISIPLGNLTGIQIFTGAGPKISVKAEPMGAVTTSFHTSFETAGINQTRYKTYIVLKATMKMVVGLVSQSAEVSTDVLVSDSIIVGGVPDTYADLSDPEQFMNLMP